MPKKCTVPPADLISLFLEQKGLIINEHRLIVGPTAPVWEEISRFFEFRVSGKYLYTFVKCNRHDVWSALGLQKESNEIEGGSEIEDENTEDTGDCSEAQNTDQMDFTITLSSEEWSKISPQEKTYQCKDFSNPMRKSREYMILLPGWTDTLNDHFWDHTRLPCSLAFKRAKITQDGKHFLTISGSCTECTSLFLGHIEHEPISLSRVLIKCTYTGDYRISHSGGSKRQLSGNLRQIAIDSLTKMKISASMYQKMLANKNMRFGDVEPSHIPSTNSLRLAKSRALETQRIDSNPVTAILKAKYTQPFQETIKDVGLDKFYVHYWSPSQLHVYRAYHEQSETPKLSVDATGSVVRRLQRPFGNTSGHIFLYEATVHDSPSRLQYSVCNMLSERHDNFSIYHWLAQWLRDGALIPKEAVCDFSIALLTALVRAFTPFNSLNAYLVECSKILYEPEKFSPPQCFVRCDVAHAVKLIASWPPIHNHKNYRVRHLYIRSMAQIIQSTSIDDLKSLLTLVFTVALSPFEGLDKVTREITHCESAKKQLKIRIATGCSEIEETLSRAVDIEDSNNMSEDQCSTDRESHRNEELNPDECSFKSWTESIVKTCEQAIAVHDGDHDNLQYLPDLVPCIVKLCRLLPLWTAVLVPYFGYGESTASSAPVESSFNDLKNRVLSHKKLPMRVDDFLETHISSLEGTMKLIAGKSAKPPSVTCENETVLVTENKENGTLFSHSTPEENLDNDVQGDFEYPLPDANKIKKTIQPNCPSETETNVLNLNDNSCPACNDGNLPTGAHRCITCKIPVHILSECSLPISSATEEEEGYGQGRICKTCSMRDTNDKKNNSFEKERDSHENWRGLGIPPKKRPRTSYLEPNKEFMNMDMKTKISIKTIGLLKNGNRASDLKPIKLKGSRCKITLQNTCSFDSLIQLLACAFCDSEQYSLFLKSINNNRMFWDIVQNIVEVGVTLKLYRQRAEVLASIFATTKLPSGITLLSTESTITDLVSKLLCGYPSVIESCLCSTPSCQANCTYHRTLLSIVMQECNMDELESLLRSTVSECTESCLKVCKNETVPCKGKKNVRFDISPYHLLLEVSVFDQSDEPHDYDISPDFNIKLSSIPSVLTIFGKQYSLRGAVGFYGNQSKKNINVIGHYVAFCRRLNQQWEAYNDIADKKQTCKISDVINCQFLLYTV